MRIEDLYPYWNEVHEELIERVGCLTADQLDIRPHDGARSIRDIVLEFVFLERFFGAHLVAGCHYEKPRPAAYPDGIALVDLMTATREVTTRVLEPLTPAGLRAVRMVPTDTKENRPETNMPIAWLLWHVVEREIACLAQVSLRLADM
jgi:hypothetical protein